MFIKVNENKLIQYNSIELITDNNEYQIIGKINETVDVLAKYKEKDNAREEFNKISYYEIESKDDKSYDDNHRVSSPKMRR